MLKHRIVTHAAEPKYQKSDICKVILLLVFFITITSMVSPPSIGKNKDAKNTPHFLRLLSISARNNTDDNNKTTQPSAKPTEEAKKPSKPGHPLAFADDDKKAPAINNRTLQKTAMRTSNIAGKSFLHHATADSPRKDNKTNNNAENSAKKPLNAPPVIIKIMIKFREKQLMNNNTAVSQQQRGKGNTLKLATKAQLQQNIIFDHAVYPTAMGKTNNFYCENFFCYEIDPETGEKIYYTCDASSCKAINTLPGN